MYHSSLRVECVQHIPVVETARSFWVESLSGPELLQAVDYNALQNIARSLPGFANMVSSTARL